VAVYNSNEQETPLFLGRFLACLWSHGDGCYFQDDDWLVHSKDALVQALVESPSVLHTMTSPLMVQLTRGWRFHDPSIGLHAGFSWLGTGAIASYRSVSAFLVQLLQRVPQSKDRRFADFFFSIINNVEPNIIEGEIEELTRDNAFSGAEGSSDFWVGVQRNFRWMQAAADAAYATMFTQSSSSLKRSMVPAVIESSYPDVLHAGSTRAWKAANRISVLAETNLMPFPTTPNKHYRPSDDIASFTDSGRSEDLQAGWEYSRYASWSLGNLVDGNDRSFFLARRPCSKAQTECVADSFQGKISLRFSVKRQELLLRWCSDGLTVQESAPVQEGLATFVDLHFSQARPAGSTIRIGSRRQSPSAEQFVDQPCEMATTTIDLQRALWGVTLNVRLGADVGGVRFADLLVL